MKISTRFAPSPSGNIHVGGMRIALLNWLYAYQNNGTFFLRIEDTDHKRSTKEFSLSIINIFEKMKVEHSSRVLVQSQRTDIYKSYVHFLLKKKHAYKCFLTEEEVQSYTKNNNYILRSPYRDKKNSNNKDDEYVIRFYVPDNKTIEYIDEIFGKISISTNTISDFILCRSNGNFTYMFTCVIDDHLTNITHVIRGSDHINNTVKQILIYQVMGWDIPYYMHIPLLCNTDRSKISKREGGLTIDSLLKEGISHESIKLYLLNIGWSSKKGDPYYKLSDIVSNFHIKKISKSEAMFDKNKLLSFEKYTIKNTNTDKLYKLYLEQRKPSKEELNSLYDIEYLIEIAKQKCKNKEELFILMDDFIKIEFNKTIDKNIKNKNIMYILDLISYILEIKTWSIEEINNVSSKFLKRSNISYKDIGEDFRIFLLGKKNIIEIKKILYILGKERIKTIVERYKGNKKYEKSFNHL